MARQTTVLFWILLSASVAGAAPPPALAAAEPPIEEQLKKIDEVIAKDDYAEAARAVAALEARGQREKSPVTFILAKAYQSRVTSLRAAYAGVQAAKGRLAKNPADAPSKRALGRFLCLSKRDWAKGLPLLRDGDDARLAETAVWELADPPDAVRQLALADRWWDLGSKDRTRDQAALNERAALWYAKAYPALQELDKKRAGACIASVTTASLNKTGGVGLTPVDLYHQLKFSELDVALGLHFSQIKPPNRSELTYFHLDTQIDNESTQGRIDNLNVILRALCIDADGKSTATELKKQLPINARGIQKVDLADVIYLSTIKHRNNNLEVPRNVYVAFRLGDERIHEAFLAPPGADAWWLDPSLIEH